MNRVLKIFAAALASCLFIMPMYAQTEGKKHHDNKEQWRAEKVAWLTSYMELTPQEAEAFWPVYNLAEQEKRESFSAIKKAYEALDAGLKAGKGEKDLSALIEAYTKALKNSQGIDSKYLSQYKRVLPIEKVGKLYVGEEVFRRQQIQKLGKK